MSVVRFGVSLEKELLEELDAYVIENQLANRSQGIRHLLNNNIVKRKWRCNNIVAGSMTFVYEPKKKGIVNKLANIQLKYHEVILSSQNFHLDQNNCLEIVAVKGKAAILTELADKIKSLKGLQHGMLTMSKAD
ncbi:MAG: nickel-responsive transcriptional regulator NikR [Cyclobacteriaceae bacterium]|nr:nickel-responsive transcriptional regulator NikR [Cyclobacteriaceae bacterium]